MLYMIIETYRNADPAPVSPVHRPVSVDARRARIQGELGDEWSRTLLSSHGMQRPPSAGSVDCRL